jgi:hypothetical protein
VKSPPEDLLPLFDDAFDGSDLADDVDVERAAIMAESPKVEAPPAPPPIWAGLVVPCPAKWFTDTPPPRRWLLRDTRTPGCDGVLPAGKSGAILGEGAVSKTQSVIQLAIAVATAGTWLGTFSVPASAAGKVLVLLGEEDAEEAWRRVFNAARADRSPMPPEGSIEFVPLAGVPCSMLVPDERGNVHGGPFLAWLKGHLQAHGPYALVIVDPLSRFAGPIAETDNAAATQFVTTLESIAACASGATVLVCHHTNKASRGAGATVSSTSARGSSSITDSVRWVATLSAEKVAHEDHEAAARLGDVVTFAVAKNNYSRKGAPLQLRRDLDHGGALRSLDHADEALVAEAQASADPRAIRAAEKVERGKLAIAEVASTIIAVLSAADEPMTQTTLLGQVRAQRGSLARDTFNAALAQTGLRGKPGPRGAVHFHRSELSAELAGVSKPQAASNGPIHQ